jgi:hypothetical protein
MRAVKGIAVALVLAALPAASAQAHVGWSIGLNFGFPEYYYHPYCYHPYPYYYYRPYAVYVAPPAVIVQPAPVYQAAPVLRPAYSSPVESAPPTQVPPPSTAQTTVWTPDGADAQLQRLQSADDGVRADAAIQLGRVRAARAVSPLSQLLAADRSAAVREAAARGLGLIGSLDALPALQRAAQADEDREVRHSAQFAAEGIRSSLPR